MGSFERIRALAIGKGNKRTVDKGIPSFPAQYSWERDSWEASPVQGPQRESFLAGFGWQADL